jgi:hypothetical protein
MVHKLFSFSLFVGILLMHSCTLDQCDQKITYTKATAIFANLDEFRNQNLVSAVQPIINPGKIYVSENLILIGEKSKGIHVIDNRNPTQPIAIHFLDIPGNHEMYIKDNYIYANSYYDLIKIDFSDLNNIHTADRLEEAFQVSIRSESGQSLIRFEYEQVTEEHACDSYFLNDQIYYFDDKGALLDESAIPTSFVSNGSTIGTANRMAFIEDELFVVNNTQLYAFDAEGSQLKSSNKINRQDYIGWNIETLYAMAPYLFIGTQTGMQIHKVSAEGVTTEGIFQHATSCDPVLPTAEEVAYVTLRSGDECPGDVNNLNVIDLNQINYPQLIQDIPLESPYGMTIIDNRLYVGQGENGLTVFDRTDPRRLLLIVQIDNISAYDIIAHPSNNGLLLIASSTGLTQYQLDDANFSQVSTITF